MNRRTFLVGVIALSLIGWHAGVALAADPATKPSAPSAPPAVGEPAREFFVDDLDGKRLELPDQTANGPLVLVVLRGYPGYQCPLCTKQFGELLGKADEFKKRGARVLFVYPGPSDRLEEYAREFAKKNKLPEHFALATDPDYGMTNTYGLRWNVTGETAYPSTFVIGKDKVVRFAKVSKTHGDRAGADEILKALDDAAAAAPAAK